MSNETANWRKEEFDNDVMGWEGTFGVDNPDYLPYWIVYMPYNKRHRYLELVGRSYKDFKTEMLKPDYDWVSHETVF